MPAALSIGITLSTSAAPDADPVADARDIESLGFDFLTVSDHPSGTHPTYETWTLLTWIAASTSRVGLNVNVLGLPYRPPPVVAKMAESLDRLSRGRLTLGLGSGAADSVFEAFGLSVRSPGEKIEALRDAICIMRGLWTESPFSYNGPQYSVHHAQIEPRADRAIPIWLGVYGPRALRLTGELADGWAPSLPYAPLEKARGMREIVLRSAEAHSRDPSSITCHMNVGVLVNPRARSRDGSIAGSAEEVVDRLAEVVRAGFTSLALWPVGDEREQRTRLAQDVVPALRHQV